jgi:hypothetical protein
VKATAKTVTRVTVTISKDEVLELVRKAGIHIPADVEVNVYGAPFDDDSDGVLLEWSQAHDADEQG